MKFLLNDIIQIKKTNLKMLENGNFEEEEEVLGKFFANVKEIQMQGIIKLIVVFRKPFLKIENFKIIYNGFEHYVTEQLEEKGLLYVKCERKKV